MIISFQQFVYLIDVCYSLYWCKNLHLKLHIFVKLRDNLSGNLMQLLVLND